MYSTITLSINKEKCILIVCYIFNYVSTIEIAQLHLPLNMTEHFIGVTSCLEFKPNRKLPAVAYSPSKFVEIVASMRHMNKAINCSTGEHDYDMDSKFNISLPATWRFCVAGYCEKDVNECKCHEAFSGQRCDHYDGHCWLIYCFLIDCKGNLESLKCVCDRTFRNRPLLGKKYWYDDGPKMIFKDPPEDFLEDAISFHVPNMEYSFYFPYDFYKFEHAVSILPYETTMSHTKDVFTGSITPITPKPKITTPYYDDEYYTLIYSDVDEDDHIFEYDTDDK